jgi:hypothetical protein
VSDLVLVHTCRPFWRDKGQEFHCQCAERIHRRKANRRIKEFRACWKLRENGSHELVTDKSAIFLSNRPWAKRKSVKRARLFDDCDIEDTFVFQQPEAVERWAALVLKERFGAERWPDSERLFHVVAEETEQERKRRDSRRKATMEPLKRKARELEIKQRSIARTLGVSDACVSDYFSGARQTPGDVRDQILFIFAFVCGERMRVGHFQFDKAGIKLLRKKIREMERGVVPSSPVNENAPVEEGAPCTN